MKKILFITLLLVGCASTNITFSRERIKLNDTYLSVEVADTPQKQYKGMSGRNSFDADGMLFVMQEKAFHQFWMKNTYIPLDMVWMTDGEVVGVTEGVQPEIGKNDTELMRYIPPIPVDFVLELPAGDASKKGIVRGVRFVRNPLD